MGAVFGREKPLKEVIRENQRMLKKAQRELEKEIASLQKNEKKLADDIKKAAKQNQMESARIMAKDIVRTRNYVTRFINMKAQLSAVSLKLQTVKSQEAMASAMKGVTKALVGVNKKMDIPGLNKLMHEFMRENEIADFTQEAIGDTIDDALEEPGSADAEDNIVNQVLDELGVERSEALNEAPTGVPVTQAAGQKHEEPALSELEERLNNLRRN